MSRKILKFLIHNLWKHHFEFLYPINETIWRVFLMFSRVVGNQLPDNKKALYFEVEYVKKVI